LLDPSRAFGFLGSFRGEPVSTAFAFVDSACGGGVYFVATEKALRGRGFGAATVSAALDELERRNVDTCILNASDLGKHVYERLGFESVCNLGRYVLPDKLSREDRKGLR
jgi:GNAT superfamily N-acetyltransferase